MQINTEKTNSNFNLWAYSYRFERVLDSILLELLLIYATCVLIEYQLKRSAANSATSTYLSVVCIVLKSPHMQNMPSFIESILRYTLYKQVKMVYYNKEMES
jgi:hypothetical protein